MSHEHQATNHPPSSLATDLSKVIQGSAKEMLSGGQIQSPRHFY